MNRPLPPIIQQKLDQTLSQCRHWQLERPLQSPPEIAQILDQGQSNSSVLVVVDDAQFVVRIDGINPSAHGLNRQVELHVLRDACRAGLAPTPRYFNPDLGTLVCDYLTPDPEQDRPLREVAELMRNIHALGSRHHRLDLTERIQRYERQVRDISTGIVRRLEPSRQAVYDLLATVNTADKARVLCHNDLLCANRVYHAGRLWALDWEYCAMASPWYDLAVVIEGDELSDSDAKDLSTAYLGRDPTAVELEYLDHYRSIYRYLEILWYLASKSMQPGDAQLDHKILLLQQRRNLSP